jgi:hypothetical protein
MRNSLIVILTLILASCKTSSKENESKDSTPELENNLALSGFQENEFPSVIDGCACYFKEKGNEAAGYIYVDDFSRIGFIKIGNNFEQLEIYDVDSRDGYVKQKCRAEHYGIDIDLQETSHEDETWQYEGTMNFSKIDGSRLKLNVVGECGC